MLAVNIYKIGSGSSKRYVDSHFVISVIDEKGKDIGRPSQTLQSAYKEIKVMLITMGGMVKDMNNIEK